MNELTLLDKILADAINGNSYCMTVNRCSPRVDIKEEKEAYTLEMELPGRSSDDVNIELNHNNLTISSKKENEKDNKSEKKNQKFILRERAYSDFERSFKLPEDVDKESINANFKNGVLTINLLKKEAELPRKIEVKAC